MKKDYAPLAKVAAIHDISGFGRCALTVIIPTLSAMGVQVCPVPTAVLSTHTGGYEGYTFLDLTDEITPYAAHWQRINLKFDAIYSGFLANATQIKLVSDFIETFGKESLVVVDPVMGDDGQIYKTYCSELCDGMKQLVKKANLITPNVTEAAYLTQTPYKPNFSKSEAFEMLDKLSDFGCEKIVITGIHNDKSIMTVYSNNGQKGVFSHKRINKNYPGTGDIFTSCLIGEMLGGSDFARAVDFSSEFVSMLIEKSSHYEYPERDGVLLEKYLYYLLKGRDCK